MKSASVFAEHSGLMPGGASDVERRPRVPAIRRTAPRVAGHPHGARLPVPATIAAEIQKAYDALVSARRLRRYAERLMNEHHRMPR